jgi:hypothetical protein
MEGLLEGCDRERCSTGRTKKARHASAKYGTDWRLGVRMLNMVLIAVVGR